MYHNVIKRKKIKNIVIKVSKVIIFFVLILNICSCNFKKNSYEIKTLDSNELKKVKNKENFTNALNVYFKEINNNALIEKLNKNNDINYFKTTYEINVTTPYEEAYNEGLRNFKSLKFEEAIYNFKRALSYPNIPLEKIIEIKFLLMNALRECNKEEEYITQLNEYKQFYNQLVSKNEKEMTSNLQKSSIIFTLLEKSGESFNANIFEKNK